MSNLHRQLLLLILLAPLAASCIPQPAPPPEVAQIPYRVLLHFSSAVPDPFYILSGPFQAYDRFRFNDSFQNRLETFVIAKSAPGATQTLELRVHATQLLTTYDRLGILPGIPPPPRLILAGLGGDRDLPLSVFDSHFDDRFDDLPEQITKTAKLQAEVTVLLPNHAPYREEITGHSVQILERRDMGLRTYDYGPLISQVQTAAIGEIDRVLQHALLQAGLDQPKP